MYTTHHFFNLFSIWSTNNLFIFKKMKHLHTNLYFVPSGCPGSGPPGAAASWADGAAWSEPSSSVMSWLKIQSTGWQNKCINLNTWTVRFIVRIFLLRNSFFLWSSLVFQVKIRRGATNAPRATSGPWTFVFKPWIGIFKLNLAQNGSRAKIIVRPCYRFEHTRKFNIFSSKF